MSIEMIGALKFDEIGLTEAEENKLKAIFKEMDVVCKAEISKEELLDFADAENKVDTIFCERVDGFIPRSHNKGGYTVSSMILDLTSALSYINDEKAREKLQKIIDDGYEEVRRDFYQEKIKELESKGVNCYEEFKSYIENNDEYDETLNEKDDAYNENDAVRFQYRIMFHGFIEEAFHFTVDASANWEAPYFRDGKGHSVHREAEFTVQDADSLPAAINAALSVVTKLFKE